MPKIHRPNIVSLFSFSFLGLGLWNGIRFIQAIIFWSTFKNYLSLFFLSYISISGIIWFSIWGIIARGFWIGKPWAWYGALISAAGYILWYWLDRAFIQQPRSNWLFALGISLFFAVGTGFLLHQKVIAFFFKNRSSPLRSIFSGKR